MHDNFNIKFISNLKTLGITTYIYKYNRIILTMLVFMTIFMLYNNIEYIYKKDVTVITELSKDYNGYVDKDYYCKAVECRYLSSGNMIIDITNYNELKDYYTIGKLMVVDESVYYIVDVNNDRYYISINKLIRDTLLYSFLFYIILILDILYYTYYLIGDERTGYMLSSHAKDTVFQYETLIGVTTNINHEVNNPLLVIKSVSSELLIALNETDFNNKKKVNTYIKDTIEYLDLLTEASDQISESISILSDYKAVRCSNGDKNIYMLVEIANKMLGKTKVNRFSKVTIDNQLKNYSIPHDTGMSNSFFLSTIMNHFLNSLEANATEVNVTLHDVVDGYIHIYIEDNGDGVKKELQNHIYDINFSSKDVANSKVKRGVGLYINKVLLNTKYGGDDKFISTTPKISTIFSIIIRENKFKG